MGLALHQGVVGLLQAIPTLIPVHGIEPAADDAHAHLVVVGLSQTHLQPADEISAAFGGRVASVQKAVDAGLDLVLFAQVDEGKQMDQVAVNAAVGQQAHEMHRAAGLFGVFHRLQQGGIFKKAVIPDVLGDAGQFLINNTAGADVGVAHLAVAHLAVGQAHVLAGAIQLGVGTGFKQLIQIGGFCGGNRVGGTGRGNAPAVQNHKQ